MSHYLNRYFIVPGIHAVDLRVEGGPGQFQAYPLKDGQHFILVTRDTEFDVNGTTTTWEELPHIIRGTPLASAHVALLAEFGVAQGDDTVMAMLKVAMQGGPVFMPHPGPVPAPGSI